MEFLKVNEVCYQQLQNIAGYLSEIEVKGRSVSYLYLAGITLDGVIQQINDDNKEVTSGEGKENSGGQL